MGCLYSKNLESSLGSVKLMGWFLVYIYILINLYVFRVYLYKPINEEDQIVLVSVYRVVVRDRTEIPDHCQTESKCSQSEYF